MSKLKITLSIFSASVVLTACSPSTSDLDVWMEEQKKLPGSTEVLIVKPMDFVPETYNGEGLVGPFNLQKLRSSLVSVSGVPACFQTQVDRRGSRPGDLELVPLDTMKIVGYMSKENSAVAMIKIENQIYEAYVGEYIGQNYGRITSISESSIYITETLLSPEGDGCEQRDVTLVIQGGAQ